MPAKRLNSPPAGRSGEDPLAKWIEHRMLDRYVETQPALDALALSDARSTFRSLIWRHRARRARAILVRVPVVGPLLKSASRAVRGGARP